MMNGNRMNFTLTQGFVIPGQSNLSVLTRKPIGLWKAAVRDGD